jgi:Family of unknown function (DUF5906)
VSAAVTLADLKGARRWVAWRTEERKGKPTKVPYRTAEARAKSDNPDTWLTVNEARAIWDTAGLMLGEHDGLWVFGIDLDTCRDAATGELTAWAREVVDRFDTYGEVSPSKTGVKLFACVDPADIPAVRDMMGTQHGKSWKQPGRGEHAPGIELHISNRFFTVTGMKVGEPKELRLISVADLRWLIEVAGPAIAGKANKKPKAGPVDVGKDIGDRLARAAQHNPQIAAALRNAAALKGGSRSEGAMGLGAALKRAGWSYEDMRSALLKCEHTSDWAAEKGAINGEREIQNIWNNAGTEVRTGPLPDDDLAEFNAAYMVVNEAGRAMVYMPKDDRSLGRRYYERITFEDFKKLHCNRTIQVGKGFIPLATAWLQSQERRQYLGGVVFDPSERHRSDELNLWQGFAVKPQVGDWSLMRAHIRDVVCSGVEEHFAYFMGWMARAVQHPAEQGEVAVVMRGVEGCGKGTAARAFNHLWGAHGLHISNAKHLVGNFNAHLRDCVSLFADEAFFAGDRQHLGVLKAIITEPHLTIEGKRQNVIQAPNYLHVMMASNEDWVVPASLEARRFFMLDVGDAVKDDHAHFGAIWAQMETGGYEAMLHDLLTHDLTGFNVRRVPVTAALQEQKTLSLSGPYAWWLDVLQRGYVSEASHEWTDWVSTETVYDSYLDHEKRRQERRPKSREALGRFLRNVAGAVASRQSTGSRRYGYDIGYLAYARETFNENTGIAAQWWEGEERVCHLTDDEELEELLK